MSVRRPLLCLCLLIYHLCELQLAASDKQVYGMVGRAKLNAVHPSLPLMFANKGDEASDLQALQWVGLNESCCYRPWIYSQKDL